MKLLLLVFLVGLSGAAVAQPAVDIVGVRDNFIVSGLAAQKCNAGDDARRDVHDRNFTIVSRRAMESIMQRTPGADPEELRKQDLAHIEKLQDAALNLIRAEGCKSDKVRALIRMHKMHESVRF